MYQTGVAVGLVSITFFFAALILAYGFRIQGQPLLPQFTSPPTLWISTGAILLSSFSFELASYSLRRGAVAAYHVRLNLVMVSAAAFGALQAAAAWQLFQQGAPVAGNPRASMFYVFMALHGAHVAGGIVWLAHLQRASRKLQTETDLRKARRVLSAAGIYWHFLGVLWLVLFFFLQRWSL